MGKVLTGLLLATLLIVGIYLSALALAANMAASFDTTEATRYTHILAFETARKRATDNRRLAGGKCNLLTVTKKVACNADANTTENQANLTARTHYKKSGPGTLPSDVQPNVQPNAAANAAVASQNVRVSSEEAPTFLLKTSLLHTQPPPY